MTMITAAPSTLITADFAEARPPAKHLLEDFAQRISALRAEANYLGHTDIGYLLEMAEEIADRRINVAAMPVPRG